MLSRRVLRLSQTSRVVSLTNVGTGKPSFGSAKRTLSRSAVLAMAKDSTITGQEKKESRQPKETTNAEQNEHLMHRPSASKDSHSTGKGNAAENPTLPLHRFNHKPRQPSNQARGFSTSTRLPSEDKTKHTAETYFKDVDSTPPSSSKTHQVDSSTSGAQILPANEPHTGHFSEKGPQNQEYETVSKQRQPYDTPPSTGPEKDEKLRYGGTPGVDSEKGPGGGGVSQAKEGPQGENKAGRKPEGRS